MKTPVIYDPNFIVYLESFQGYSFIHCACFTWNKTVKKKLQKDINTLVALHNCPIFAFHDKEDNKHFKFLTMLDFKYNTDIPCSDGKIRQIFVRSL
jgi:hypothetical protein